MTDLPFADNSTSSERSSLPPEGATRTPSDVKDLLEQNLKLTTEIHAMMRSMKRYMMWQRITSFIYLFILIAPVVWAVIYLPPLIRPYIDQYQQLLDNTGASSGTPLDIQKILNQIGTPGFNSADTK